MEISVNGRAAQPDSTGTPGVSRVLLRSGNKWVCVGVCVCVCMYMCARVCVCVFGMPNTHKQTELIEHSMMLHTGFASLFTLIE